MPILLSPELSAFIFLIFSPCFQTFLRCQNLMITMLFFQHDPIAIEDNLRYDINFLTFRLDKSITSLSLLHIPPQFTPLEIMPRCSALYTIRCRVLQSRYGGIRF